MYTIELDAGQFESIRKKQFSHPDPYVRKKLQAVLLVAQNVKRQIVCQALGVNRATLASYVKFFLDEGLEKNRYHKPVSPLMDHVVTLEKYFDEHPPHSVNEAIEVIKNLTGLEYKKSFAHKFLVSLGYAFRKTGGIPPRADLAKQEEFKKNA